MLKVIAQFMKNRRKKVNQSNLDTLVSSHKIDVAHIRSNDFDKFFICRAKALLDVISAAMGKTISNQDSAETIAIFGDEL